MFGNCKTLGTASKAGLISNPLKRSFGFGTIGINSNELNVLMSIVEFMDVA